MLFAGVLIKHTCFDEMHREKKRIPCRRDI